jgi:hypothetical protein
MEFWQFTEITNDNIIHVTYMFQKGGQRREIDVVKARLIGNEQWLGERHVCFDRNIQIRAKFYGPDSARFY